MKNFQILRYIKKLLPIIIVLCLVATCFVYYKLSTSNSYIASEVIHYNDPQAEKGLAPTGDKLDVNEIKSSAVMSKVVDMMGLTGIYSVDSLISRINITPVEDPDKVAQKDAMLEEGEEYIYEPSTFIVSFAATSSEGPDFSRTVLDNILDVYFERFSQQYVNVSPADNTIKNLDKNDYDFIEIMELIDSSINNTLTTLYQRIDQNNFFRSSETGTTFTELANEFDYLRHVKISSILSDIYNYQITKDKSILISDYTTRIDNNNISNAKEESIVEDVVTVINAYVEKMRDSGNTNISYEYILDTLHEKNLQDYFGDQTVTYDELIYSWRDHEESRKHAIIDSAYCKYIIDTFTACKDGCNGECKTTKKTCVEFHNADYATIKASVESDINGLIDELNSLYEITTLTNNEYNKYLGASYISVLSSSSIRESINVLLYTAIAFFFLVVLCCGGAILLGRIGDIVNYIFYTDHLTELSNRAYFDKYLKSKNKKLLDDGVVYCTVDISNLAEINSVYSREVGDGIIKMFTEYLKESFGKSKTEYIYNGNGSFIMLTEEADYITVEDIMRLFRLRLDDRDEHRSVVIKYKIGIAETFKQNKTARKLLSEAIESKKLFVSEIGTD